MGSPSVSALVVEVEELRPVLVSSGPDVLVPVSPVVSEPPTVPGSPVVGTPVVGPLVVETSVVGPVVDGNGMVASVVVIPVPSVAGGSSLQAVRVRAERIVVASENLDMMPCDPEVNGVERSGPLTSR